MKETIISRRYARALLAALREEDAVEQGREVLQALAGAFEADPEIAEFFKNPEVKDSKKADALDAALEKLDASPAIRSFAGVLCGNRRSAFLPDIAREYARFADEELGILDAQVFSATDLDTETVDRVRKTLEARTGKNVRLRAQVDPALLGGIAVRMDNRVIDGSLRGRLESMKKHLQHKA